MAIVGYRYPSGNEFGKREEIYRVELTNRKHYDQVVKNIKQQPGTIQQKAKTLFLAFKPTKNRHQR